MRNLGEEPLDLPPTDLLTTGYWLSLSEETVSHLREAGMWTNDPNDYGPDWPRIRDRVRPATNIPARSAARSRPAASMTCITRLPSVPLHSMLKQTVWKISPPSAHPVTTKWSRTSACAAGFRGWPMCWATLRRYS